MLTFEDFRQGQVHEAPFITSAFPVELDTELVCEKLAHYSPHHMPQGSSPFLGKVHRLQ